MTLQRMMDDSRRREKKKKESRYVYIYAINYHSSTYSLWKMYQNGGMIEVTKGATLGLDPDNMEEFLDSKGYFSLSDTSRALEHLETSYLEMLGEEYRNNEVQSGRITSDF